MHKDYYNSECETCMNESRIMESRSTSVLQTKESTSGMHNVQKGLSIQPRCNAELEQLFQHALLEIAIVSAKHASIMRAVSQSFMTLSLGVGGVSVGTCHKQIELRPKEV